MDTSLFMYGFAWTRDDNIIDLIPTIFNNLSNMQINDPIDYNTFVPSIIENIDLLYVNDSVQSWIDDIEKYL